MPHMEGTGLILDVGVSQENHCYQHVSNLGCIHVVAAQAEHINEVAAGMGQDGADVHSRVAATVQEPKRAQQQLYGVTVKVRHVRQVQESHEQVDVISGMGMPVDRLDAVTQPKFSPWNGFGVLAVGTEAPFRRAGRALTGCDGATRR